jgi:hypothetical protein
VIYPGKQTVWFFYLMKYFLSLEKGYATARHYIIGILKKGLCDGHCNFTIPMSWAYY